MRLLGPRRVPASSKPDPIHTQRSRLRVSVEIVKRDPRLAGLSADHHRALVLARRAAAGALPVAALRVRFDEELEPHFRIEEDVLLPALCQAGDDDLAARTLRDHARMRDALSRAEAGDPKAVAEFSALLVAHVRFEERELFPACEMKLSPTLLEEVWTRRPHRRDAVRS